MLVLNSSLVKISRLQYFNESHGHRDKNVNSSILFCNLLNAIRVGVCINVQGSGKIYMNSLVKNELNIICCIFQYKFTHLFIWFVFL